MKLMLKPKNTETWFTGIIMITAVVGVVFGLQTLKQATQSLEETRKANQGNLILSLNRDFFFNDRLYNVRKAIENDKPILIEHQGKLTDQDLEDYIGMFETMDDLRTRKILDQDLLDNNFCSYISEAYNNSEIKNYISDVRKENDGLYSGFENLAKEECK